MVLEYVLLKKSSATERNIKHTRYSKERRRPKKEINKREMKFQKKMNLRNVLRSLSESLQDVELEYALEMS